MKGYIVAKAQITGKGEIQSIKKKASQSHWEQNVGIRCKMNKALEGRFGAILQGL